MAEKSRRPALVRTPSLNTRVLLLTGAIFIVTAMAAFLAFDRLVNTAVVRLGTLFAEKQVQFDRYRGLETLFREASLAQTLARSPAILEWAMDEDEPDKRARGLAELEHYRLAFKDRSYFFVIDKSANYYFNDRDDAYAGQQLRYTLSPDNPRDGWYYKTIRSDAVCQLNVDHDDNIRVTKVWVNCPVREGDQVLGMIGTGIDLTDFIREVVDFPQRGIDSVFVDASGAIQAHRDPRMVDFHSLTKDAKSKKTIFRLLEREQDRKALAAMMKRVAAEKNRVESRFVEMEGHQVLAGVGYLDQIGWFNVTLMDVDQLIERQLFNPIGAFLAVVLAAATLLVTLLFRHVVLNRLARLEAAVHQVKQGDFSTPIDPVNDEIGRLSRSFSEMAREVGDNTRLLESRVQERTEKLERLAYMDPLTEVYNRRGFVQAVEGERNRAARHGHRVGLLLIDVDMFKSVNDGYGHHGGDQVLAELARRLRNDLRSYDIAARWGGDEFVVLISECGQETLRVIAHKISASFSGAPILLEDGREVDVTASIGACLAGPDEPVDRIIARVDAALYVAKGAGRDRVIVMEPA
ncbi:diguanylate cyclase [Iodidimonas sp. SYSU 1G8]|uniref:GGDEF domain-containing protein n=1 Tax=Iodidimonas sp. SYSU 1G8 TaxID=3133967 RepID=UPI0031FF1EF4